MTDVFPPRLRSRATVLRLDNVDTDVITPIARVLEGREALARYAFEPLRFDPDGTPLPNDPFTDADRQGAEILLAGRNFGCGSSRETAAWAVRDLGFRVVVAPSFGDIFYSNCLKNGVLPIRLAAEAVVALMDHADALKEIEVSLPEQMVRAGSREFAFQVGALQKRMLTTGLDEIGLLLSRVEAQRAFEARDTLARPWVRNRQPSSASEWKP